VSRYLFVGGETAANPEVVQKAEEFAAKDKEAQFALLVPATQVRLLLGRHEGEDVEVAKRMAEEARRKFAECGIRFADTDRTAKSRAGRRGGARRPQL
jgi:hypothetical protein